jgi:hypothetical protein
MRGPDGAVEKFILLPHSKVKVSKRKNRCSGYVNFYKRTPTCDFSFQIFTAATESQSLFGRRGEKLIKL